MKRLWRALAFLAAAGAALVLSTSAFAVGAGSSQSQTQWKAALGRATWSGKLTALYPGARDDAERFAVTITNAGKSAQVLHSVTASVQSKTNGCRASWFTVSIDGRDRRLPAQLAPGASYAAHVNLVMRDSGTNQDSCRRTAPAVTVTAQ